MNQQKKVVIYNIVIAVLLVIYIVLTTLIFINHKKIAILKQKIVQTKNKTKIQNNESSTYIKNNKTVHSKKNSGNINTTIKKHQQKMQEQKPDSEAYFKLGVLYFAKAGKEQQAIDCFRKTLNLKPNHSKKAAIQLWINLLQKKLNKGNKN
ncbi:hypothetical protein [Candidatus Uabimicrobium sp. HlEnr_7]|uniref:hypothetical protein n=1 Tax=Candidatus Uabimicrobium helgolandensis TaxID=3095367 RepID=UPI003558AB30